MRLEQDFIEKVREANNLVEIIGQHTTLKGRGDQHMGLCPFPDHKEKTPSFSVSESKQVYHCFGCKKSGNIFTFLEAYNGFAFMETIEYLARRASIEIPKAPAKPGYKPQKKKEDRSTGYKINRYAAFYYFQNLKNLPETHKAKAYLAKRGLSPEICEEFRLGYATEDWDGLIKYFKEKNAPMKVVEELGLVRKNKNGGFFDLFRDRIMYPIFSLSDEVVGFGGRIIDEGQPKYINSVESAVFKKGKIFYGLNRSVRSIRSEDRVFVVEGYMDYLALYAQGITNVVATLGTALTPDHVKLVKRWTKTVVLLFDGDQAGQSASERSLQNFFEQGVCPLIMTLENGMDPDDYLKANGKEGFLEKAAGVEDLFLVTLGRWLKGYRGLPKEKVELLDRLKPLLASLSDQRLRTMYIDEVAQRLGESPRRVFEWLKSAPDGPPARVRAPEPKPPGEDFIEENQKVSIGDAPYDELLALALALKAETNLVYFIQEDLPSAIYHTEIRRFFAQIVDKYGQQPTAFDKLTHFVVSRVENPEKIFNLINISTPETGENEDQRMVRECLYRVKDRHLKRLASVLASEIKSQPSDEKLEQIMNIQKDRLALKRLKDGVSQESSSHGESN